MINLQSIIVSVSLLALQLPFGFSMPANDRCQDLPRQVLGLNKTADINQFIHDRYRNFYTEFESQNFNPPQPIFTKSMIDQTVESNEKLGIGLKYINESAIVGVRGPVEGGWVYESPSDVANTRHDSADVFTLLWVHGGGYFLGNALGSIKYLWQLCRRFNAEAAKAGSKKRLVIFSVQYPLYSIDAALNAATDAYKWLVNEVGVKSLSVGGDSAGGNCAIGLINHIKQSNALSLLPVQISSAILISPWVQPNDYPVDDLHHYNDFLFPNPAKERKLFEESVKYILNLNEKMLMKGHALNDPRVSPVYLEDMAVPEKGFFIDYGKAEILAVAIEKFISKIPKDKVQVQAQEGMYHTYTNNIQAMETVDPMCLRYSDESIDRSISYLIKNYV